MYSTLENCPEMTQSMLDEEQRVKDLEVKNDSFLKIARNLSFQEQEIHDFSNDFVNSRRLKQRKGPQYRKINTYYKSKNQYWKERKRRKKAWELSGQGSNYKQIAEKLGVSEKTVQRDIKKIGPYYLRLSKKYFRELEQQRVENLNAELEGKTLSQQFNILTNKMVYYRFLMKQREYNRHMIKIIVDMDDLTDGCPAIRFWPKPPLTLRGMPYIFQFHVKRNGNQVYLGDFSLS